MNSIPFASNVHAYMKNSRLQSCFGASKFSDGALNPCSFFGINSEFSKRKATINEELYTCSFNLSRATLQVDSSYFETIT